MHADVAEFLDEIDELLNSGRFGWAESTLSGIADTVRSQKVVTPGQRAAVEHIVAGGNRARELELPSERMARRTSRRHEGFQGSD